MLDANGILVYLLSKIVYTWDRRFVGGLPLSLFAHNSGLPLSDAWNLRFNCGQQNHSYIQKHIHN